jgi:hypothetical protein
VGLHWHSRCIARGTVLMPGLFSPRSDLVLRIALVAMLIGVVGLPITLMVYVRTPYAQDRELVAEQPVQFDHRHHVQDDEIACLYCHTGAERSTHAGVPAADVCMGCHAQIWNESQFLAPVRDSFFLGEPLAWSRVHDLPDFVYFDHSVHVAAGVTCAQCHGDVGAMPLVHKEHALTMQFCLDCHRDPAAHVEGYERWRGAPRPTAGTGFVDDTLMTCTACHR